MQKDFSLRYASDWEVLCAITYINKVLTKEGEFLGEFEEIRDAIFDGDDEVTIDALKNTKKYYSELYFSRRKN